MRLLSILSSLIATFLLASSLPLSSYAQFNRFDVVGNSKREINRTRPQLPSVPHISPIALDALSRKKVSGKVMTGQTALDSLREYLSKPRIALKLPSPTPMFDQNLLSKYPLYLSPMHRAEANYIYYELENNEDADYVEGCKSRLKNLLAYRASNDSTLWVDGFTSNPFHYPAKKYYMRLVEIYEDQDSLQMAQAVLADAIEFDSISRKEYLTPMVSISLGLDDKETAARYATMQAEDYAARADSLTDRDWEDALELSKVLIVCGHETTAYDYLRVLEPYAPSDDIYDKINALIYVIAQAYADVDIADYSEESLRLVIEILDEAQRRDADARLMTNKRPLLPDEMSRISQLCRIYEALDDIDKLEYYASIEAMGNYWERLYFAVGSFEHNVLLTSFLDNDYRSETADRYLRHPESEALRKVAINHAIVLHTIRIPEFSQPEYQEYPLLMHLDSILNDNSDPNLIGWITNVNASNFYEAVDSVRLQVPKLQQLFEALTKNSGSIRATMPKKSMVVIPGLSREWSLEDGYEYAMLIGKDESEDRIGKIVDDTFPFIDYLKKKGIKELYIIYPTSKQNPYAWEQSLPKKIKPIRATLTSFK